MTANFGYNVGRVFLEELYNPVTDYKHRIEEELLQKISDRNAVLKDVAKLTSDLTKKKRSSSANFNDNPEMISLIQRIRAADDSVIADHTYSWNSEEDITTQIQALNDFTKRLGDEANLDLMRIQHAKQDKTQVTETTKKAIEEQIEFIRTMNRRAGQ